MVDEAAARVERNLFVRTLFGGLLSGRNLEAVTQLMSDAWFDAGQELYRQGEVSRLIYFIVSGEVVLETPGQVPWKFVARDGIGFQDAMQDQPHSRTARALTDVHALAFSVEEWFDVLEGHPELGRGAVMGHARSVARMIDELGLEASFPRAPIAPGSSDFLRSPGLVERMLVLTESPLFNRAGIQAVAGLARLAHTVRVPRGDVVRRQGDPRAGIEVVAQGELSLRRDETEGAGWFAPGSVVGSLGVVAKDEHDSTLHAQSDSVVLEIRQDDLFEVMEDHFDLARAVFAYMARERGRLMRLVAERRGG